jgi:hypothetical protein
MQMRRLFKSKQDPKQAKEDLMLGESLAKIFISQVDSGASAEDKDKEIQAYLAKNTGRDELEYASKYLHAQTERVEKDILAKINLVEAAAITYAHKTLTKEAKAKLSSDIHATNTENTAQFALNAHCLTHPGEKDTRVKCMELAKDLDNTYQLRAKHIKARENIMQHQNATKLKTVSSLAVVTATGAQEASAAAAAPPPAATSPTLGKK